MSEEKPDYKFTGWIIPKPIVDLFHEQVLSVREVILLAMIHSLSGEDGCFASNAYISKQLQVRKDYVGRMLSHLEELKLIERACGEDGERRLSVAYIRSKGRRTPVLGVADASPRTPRTPVLRYKKEDKKDYTVGRADAQPNGIEKVALTFEQKASRRLIRELSSRRLLTRKASIQKWSKEFAALRKMGIPKVELKETLLWYCRNLDSPYMPQAYSAKAFRDKYPAIRKRMQRTEVKQPESVSAESLSEDQRALYREVVSMGWPKGSKTQLAFIVQESWNQFLKFRNARKEKADSLSGELKELHSYIKLALWRAPHSSLLNYMSVVHSKLEGWKKWNGDLSPYVWRPDNSTAMSMGKELTEEFNGNPSMYQKYLEALGYAH